MLSPHDIRACALQVLKTHGDEAPRFVTEQIGALALAGDAGGIAAWQAIARCIVEMAGLQVQPGTRH